MASKAGKKGASQPRQSFEALLREQEEEKHSGGGSRAGKRSKAEGASSGDGGGEDEGFVPARLSQRILVAAKEQAQEVHAALRAWLAEKVSADVAAARLVAAHIGSEHHEVIVSEADMLAALPEVVAAIESFTNSASTRIDAGEKGYRPRESCAALYESAKTTWIVTSAKKATTMKKPAW